MRPTSKTYETRLPSSRNQRANLDVSGRVEATMSSSVFSDWLCKTRPRKNKHMTHVTVCCSNFNAQNDWSFLFQIGKIAEFIPEQLCLAQFHPSTMKTSNSVPELSKLAQLRTIADVACHVGTLSWLGSDKAS